MTRTPTPRDTRALALHDAPAAPTGTEQPGEQPRSLRRTYAALPTLAGRNFLPVAFVARMPFSMITIGTLLLVSTATGSLALGGLASATSAVGTALAGPAQGALADRFGQRRVLLVVVPLEVLAILALVLAVPGDAAAGTAAVGDAATSSILLAAAAMGASAPQVGPLARVRWIALTRRSPRTLLAAMSYESTADEVSFVLGPALVGVLAATWSPTAAMVIAAALCATFGLAFALHPTARAVAPREQGTTTEPGGPTFPRLLRRVLVPVTGMVAMGLLFGGVQTAVTSFMRDAGSAGSAGLVYAVMGAGSAVTALAVVALPARWEGRSRWVTFAVGLLAGALATVAAAGSGELGLLVAALAVTGLFVGPVMVTVFTVGGDLAPTGRAGAVMTLLASANVVGVALGAAVGGQLAERAGTLEAFTVPVLASVLLVVTGLSLRSRPRTGTPEGSVRHAAVL